MEINFENFIKFNIQVGTIVDVKENKKARKPAYVIDIDFGEKKLRPGCLLSITGLFVYYFYIRTTVTVLSILHYA